MDQLINQDQTSKFVESYIESLDEWLEERTSFRCELSRWENEGGHPTDSATYAEAI